jgi:hypothetical protein
VIDRVALARILHVEYEFAVRPVAVPGDLRPLWRLATICLILKNCRGAAATLKQLHVLSWALRDGDSREAFLLALGDAAPVRPIVRIEPSLNRALDFAIAERLIVRSSTRLTLAERGLDLVRRIEADPDAFVEEKRFFSMIKKKVTTVMIDHVLVWNTLL